MELETRPRCGRESEPERPALYCSFHASLSFRNGLSFSSGHLRMVHACSCGDRDAGSAPMGGLGDGKSRERGLPDIPRRGAAMRVRPGDQAEPWFFDSSAWNKAIVPGRSVLGGMECWQDCVGATRIIGSGGVAYQRSYPPCVRLASAELRQRLRASRLR